jgi:hypothetical protein
MKLPLAEILWEALAMAVQFEGFDGSSEAWRFKVVVHGDPVNSA